MREHGENEKGSASAEPFSRPGTLSEMGQDTTIPNPGSTDALAAGCRCAVLDNNHGIYPPWPGAWWINADCQLHAEWVPPKS